MHIYQNLYKIIKYYNNNKDIHQLTTSMPQAFHVAIKRGRKVSVPSFPIIEVHHYTEDLLKFAPIKPQQKPLH